MTTTEKKEIRVKLYEEACERLKEKVYGGLSERLKEEYRLFIDSGIIKFKTQREKGLFFIKSKINEFEDVEWTDYGNGEFMRKYRQSLMND